MQKGTDLEQVLTSGSKHIGLPCLLSYKIGNKVGEILMTNGGPSLEKWSEMENLESNSHERANLMITMLHQIIPGLQKMHEFGYSHGDLKPENICGRKSHDGTWKFTLIDLGMSSKLPKLG